MQTALTRCRSPELRSVDRAAGELCTVELDGAAVQALPGHPRVLPEVPGDDTYHRVFRLLGGSGCTAELIRLASSAVLGHYGRVCACCGSTDRPTIDRIDGN